MTPETAQALAALGSAPDDPERQALLHLEFVALTIRRHVDTEGIESQFLAPLVARSATLAEFTEAIEDNRRAVDAAASQALLQWRARLRRGSFALIAGRRED